MSRTERPPVVLSRLSCWKTFTGADVSAVARRTPRGCVVVRPAIVPSSTSPCEPSHREPFELGVARRQRGVAAAGAQQILVAAALDDAPAVEHDDLLGVADRRESMRDRNCRPARRESVERLL